MKLFEIDVKFLLVSIVEHIFISFSALIMSVILAVSIGFLIRNMPRVAKLIIGLTEVIQTIPSLAVLAFFIPIFGIGKVPAIIALVLYGTLPILKNTYLGLISINKTFLQVGDGLGMSSIQRICYIEFPIAFPYIISGIRISAVYLIGWATLASFIGGGGLGDLIFDGLNLYRADLVLAGSIPVMIFAILCNYIFNQLEMRVISKGFANKEN